MAEYIEREAAVKALMKDAAFCVRHLQDGEGRGYIGASKTIGSIPAADVAPVWRGEWEQYRFGPDDYALRLRCSRCRKVVYERGFHFCPGCGADMRGADNGTN